MTTGPVKRKASLVGSRFEIGLSVRIRAAVDLDESAAMPHITRVQIVATTTYERSVRKLLSAQQRQAMELAIAAEPLAAPIIRGSGGIRKFRWGGSGRGKSGGVRTIYFHYAEGGMIYLLTVYAKADREDLKPGDLKAWARVVAAIKREGRA